MEEGNVKKLIHIIISALVLLEGAGTYAQKANECVETQPKELKSLLEKDKLSGKEISKAYDALATLVDKKVYTVKDLLDLCLLYSKHDRSDAVYTFAATIKDANPVEFEKAVNELSKEDAAKIKEFIEISDER
jgi:hypothetical protein